MNSSGVILNGSAISERPLKECQSKTHKGGLAQQEEGVQLNAAKWVCGTCYRRMISRKG